MSGLGSTLGGIGSLLQGVGSLLPTQTSGYTTAWGNGTAKNNSTLTTVGKVTNSADPEVIASLKSLVGQEEKNATDPNATANLVAGIFQNAKDAFASVFGQGGAAGVYNSATTQQLGADASARATADAASAVLTYQTNEQQLAGSQLGSLLSATATQSSDTTATGQQTTDTTQWSHSQNAGSSGKSLGSVICSRMWSLGKIGMKDFALVHQHFDRSYPDWAKVGYQITVWPLFKEISRNPESVISRAGMRLFAARINYIIGKDRSWKGFLATKFIFLACCPAAFLFAAPFKYITHGVYNTYKFVR